MLIVDLINNLTLIVTIAVIYELLHIVPERPSRLRRLIAGSLFGLASVFAMMAPMEFAPGIIYDGRSILVTIAGLMTGATGGIVAALIAAAYRISLGGPGVVAGVAVVATSGLLGVVSYYLKRRSDWWKRPGALLLLAFVVHALMLLYQFLFLPHSVRGEVVRTVGPVVLIGYPAAFVVISRLMIEREDSRRVARQKLTSEELYRGLFEDTHVAMLAVDPEDGRILRANTAAEQFYGWSKEELATMRLSDINVLSEEAVFEEMELARREEKGYFNFRHRRADGSVRDVAVWSGGATVGERELLHSVIFDITDRKAAERERDLMILGIDHAPLGVVRVREADAVVEMANRRACSLLGYKRGEVVGMRIFDFDPIMDEERWAEHRRRARSTGEYTFETVH